MNIDVIRHNSEKAAEIFEALPTKRMRRLAATWDGLPSDLDTNGSN